MTQSISSSAVILMLLLGLRQSFLGQVCVWTGLQQANIEIQRKNEGENNDAVAVADEANENDQMADKTTDEGVDLAATDRGRSVVFARNRAHPASRCSQHDNAEYIRTESTQLGYGFVQG